LALGAGIFVASTILAYRKRKYLDAHTWMVEITDTAGESDLW